MAGTAPVPQTRPTAKDAAALKSASDDLASDGCTLEKDSTPTKKKCKAKVAIVITVTRKKTLADAHATLGDLDVRREGDASPAVTGGTVEQPRGSRNLGHGMKEYPVPAGTYDAYVKPFTAKNGTLGGRARKKAVKLKNVPNFDEILIHTGNNPQDSEGCILANATTNVVPVMDKTGKKVVGYHGQGSSSKGTNQAILDFIFKVQDEENDGEEPKITVIIKD